MDRRRYLMSSVKKQESSTEEWDYFTIIAEEEPVEMLVIPPYMYDDENEGLLKFSYSLNGGSWIECLDEISITIPSNSNVRFKSEDPGWGAIDDPFVFTSENPYWVDGTIMSLLYGDDFNGKYNLNDRFKHGILTFYYEGETGTTPITPGLVGIKSLKTLLPATTLASDCYSYMFQSCTSLENAPELPATTLVSNCYSCMFEYCTNLRYIKALFTTTPSDDYTYCWVSGVASAGTFVKSKDATWDVTGVNGVPSGWAVYADDEVDDNTIFFYLVDAYDNILIREERAEKGMTWAEFAESDYNTSNITVIADSIYYGAYPILNVSASTVIENGVIYLVDTSVGPA